MRYLDMPRPEAKAKEPSLDTGHDANRRTRVEKTYAELIEQPSVFQKALEYAERNLEDCVSALRNRTVAQVVFVGCGDSLFIGSTLEVLAEELLGGVCRSLDAFEFSAFRSGSVDSGSIVIGQSASGTTPTVLDSLRKAKTKGAFTIGLSNTAGAALLKEADFGILVPAKREGWPTQSTTAATGILALLLAKIAISKGKQTHLANEIISELGELPGKIENTIETNSDNIQKHIAMFSRDVYFQTTGCGVMYGAALVACAKLRELCPVHGSCHQLEEFHHYRTLKPNDPLILFIQGGIAAKRELDTALVGAYDGGKIVLVGSDIPSEMLKTADLICSTQSTNFYLQPILSMTAAQLFAYHLAQAKFANGIGYPMGI